MNRPLTLAATLALAAVAQPAKPADAAFASPFADPLSIPLRENIEIDGELNDWLEGTFTEVSLFADNAGRAADPNSHAATTRIAWSQSELLLALSVRDDRISEAQSRYLWIGDALVTLVSAGATGQEPILFMLTPGIDADGQPIEPRTLLNDHRKNPELKSISPEPRYACLPTDQGYQIELAFPLAALGIDKPELGDQLCLQLDIKDRDEGDSVQALELHPLLNSTRNPQAFYPLVLDDAPDLRPSIQAKARLVNETTAEIIVYADPSLAGIALKVEFPNNAASATLDRHPGSPYASVRFATSYSIENKDPWLARVLLGKRLVAGFDFTKATWVSSQNNYAPVPSLSAMLAFEEDRRKNDYSKDALLVIGSSSVRMWKSIKEDLAPYEVIHRGFGGSSMGDVVGAYRYLVEPYQTNRYLIYEGDTDSVRGDQKAFLQHARTFVDRISVDRPDATIAFITPKPSPARAHLWNTNYREAREGLHALAAQFDNVHVIDVGPPLLDTSGQPNEALFLADRVHFNEAGYELWTQAIRSQLESIFGPPQR